MTSPTAPQPPTTPPDFWGFVRHASARLREMYGDDSGATEVLLVLNRASGIVTYDLESAVDRPRGRSWAAFRALYVLWLAGPQDASHLAALTGQTRQGVSNLTRGLVDEGLVERRDDETDGRRVLLDLTDAGRTEIESLYAEHHAREQRWVSVLDADERRELVRLLDKLVGDRPFAIGRR